MTDLIKWNDKGYLAFNPHAKPVEELPTIHGFNNGGQPGLLLGCLLSDDGEPLGSHACSSEFYMYGDLAINHAAEHRHKIFREHYPDGYKMDFITYDEVTSHPGLAAAFTAYENRYRNKEPTP